MNKTALERMVMHGENVFLADNVKQLVMETAKSDDL